MSLPRISVVIPSYNHEKYVKETIESVLNQTFQDFEIIITDDGSSDRTVDKIKEFDDERIKLFVFEENQGACVAVNNCINKSKGEFIAVLSSDDFWELDKLEKQVKFLDENFDIAATFSKAYFIDENSEVIENWDNGSTYSFYENVFDVENRSKEEWSNHFFMNGNCLCHPSMLIRKEIYNDVGLYDERMANLPDFDMWIRICLKYDIHIMDEKLISFRIRDDDSNVSAMTLKTAIRSKFEFNHVFNHYLSIENKEHFIKIFPESDMYGHVRNDTIPYFLARLAIELGIDNRQIWGLNIIYDFMTIKKNTEILKEEYNFTYKYLIEMASEKDSFHIGDLANLRNSLHKIDSLSETVEYYTNKSNNLINENTNLKVDIAGLNNKVNKYQDRVAELNNKVTKYQDKIKIKNKELKLSNQKITILKSSVSWKLTKPLRKIGHFLRKIK
ncbi:MAG: glycosyltransferase [Methanobacteriaceae archaeon]